jgi:putative transposase
MSIVAGVDFGTLTVRVSIVDGKRSTKRSLLTEASGVPVGLTVEGANRHDKKLVEATLESIAVERPEPTGEKP